MYGMKRMAGNSVNFETKEWKESEVAQLCPTLCDPMDCSLSGSSIHGIFKARILEWVAISFSRGSSRPRIEPGSPALQADALPSEPPGKPKKNVKVKKKVTLEKILFWRMSRTIQ